MPGFSRIPDHGDQAVADFGPPFNAKPLLAGLIRATGGRAQGPEDALYQCQALRLLSGAPDQTPPDTNVQLDQYGVICGEARGALSDADYRRFLQARIATNVGQGEAWRVIAVMKTVTGASVVHLWRLRPATLMIECSVPAPLTPEARTRAALQVYQLVPSGVEVEALTEVLIAPGHAPFGFDGDPDALGFGAGELSMDISHA